MAYTVTQQMIALGEYLWREPKDVFQTYRQALRRAKYDGKDANSSFVTREGISQPRVNYILAA